ncbi:MAG: methyltransferase [Spirosomataceae bacterium]
MNLFKHTRKWLGKWFLIPLTHHYLSKDRNVRVGEISLIVPTGVFHPTLFSSTLFLLDFIQKYPFKTNERVLELGAGSGLLAVAAAKRGASVTASDVNEKACAAVAENALRNDASVEVIHSDLLEKLKGRTFDLLLINPPYYPRNPKSDAEKAWFCGENFDYFQKLFVQLREGIAEDGKAIMVLSEDCAITAIRQLAEQAGLSWQQTAQKKSKGEWNYLFEIKKQA